MLKHFAAFWIVTITMLVVQERLSVFAARDQICSKVSFFGAVLLMSQLLINN